MLSLQLTLYYERAWWSSHPGMDINYTAQLVLSKSTDDGKTWKMHNYARTNTTEAQVVEVEPDRKSTRLNSSHPLSSRMPSSA